MRPTALLLLLTACGGDPETTEPTAPVCDGRLQDDEDSVDAPFDKDGDGFFDMNDPDCAANYAEGRLDCDDTDAARNPDAVEVTCNGLDEDCNSDTADAKDEDQDGTTSCDDCDDLDPLRWPDNPEICWDEVDNDCDGETDPGCGLDYSGLFDLDQHLQYGCSLGLVDIDFQQVNVVWNPPYGGAMSSQGGSQPGIVNGTIDEDGSFVFEAKTVLGTPASCSEFYRFSGTFLDRDNFVMTFEAVFLGGFACLNCENQTWTDIVGTRAK